MIKSSAAEENMSNLTSASGDSSSNNNGGIYPLVHQQPLKKKRNQPGHPDPDAEVIALSPKALMATNRFLCEICNKGFQRDQNLQLHRRGHNLPWKLKQRSSKEIRKKVYVCPETSCVHHDPSRALGDLTGIKKHFCRKHGEKKWKCDKCSKKYAVQSDWKAHSKTCGTREYRCDCGTLFSRRDSFITHRAFCDALAEESARSGTNNNTIIPIQNAANSSTIPHVNLQCHVSNGNELPFSIKKEQQHNNFPPWLSCLPNIGPHIDLTTTPSSSSSLFQDFQQNQDFNPPNPNPSLGPTTLFHHHPQPPPSPHISATALLQKAAQMGAKSSSPCPSPAGVFSRAHQGHVSAAEQSGFGSSSRDEFLTVYGNKAATVTVGGGATTGGTTNTTPPPSLLQDMFMSNFQDSTFEDMSFGAILNSNSSSKKVQENLDFHATIGQFSRRSSSSNGGNEGNDDGMTRDFLGLRPLSQSDIMSIAGLSNCMNSNSCNENQNQNQRSWQG
ncbi:hypothetical protein ACS0TY_036187 [Phlomoides rotata]